MVTRVHKHSVLEQAVREHKVLESKLKYLVKQLEKRQLPLSEIARLLDDLGRFLVAHFRKEESGGFFEMIIQRAPHLSRLADNLTHEHSELQERLNGLIGFARRGTGQPLCWRMLSLRLQDFTARLHKHESRENGLLQMAYSDDLGISD